MGNTDALMRWPDVDSFIRSISQISVRGQHLISDSASAWHPACMPVSREHVPSIASLNLVPGSGATSASATVNGRKCWQGGPAR